MQFARAPTGFIPEQDQGYLITVVQLPPGATLDRTEAVVKRAIDIILKTPGIEHVAPFAGLDATTFTVSSNAGTIFSGLPSLYNHDAQRRDGRDRARRPAQAPLGDPGRLCADDPAAAGARARQRGRLQADGAGPRRLGSDALARAANALVAAANKDPDFAGVFTLFSTRSPTIYTDIDREKAEKVGLTPTDVFSTLQVYLGSQYVNDFNYLGRTYEVIAQADGSFRRDAGRHRTAQGAQHRGRDGADRHGRAPAARDRALSGAALQSLSRPPRSWASPRRASRPARRWPGWRNWRARCCRPASASNGPSLPSSRQQRGTPTMLVFGAAALFVFLVLAAQYESWKLPLAVVLIVPMCLLASVTGLLLRDMSIDVLAQIGFVVLVGLAAKNAILIVEFARQAQEQGASADEASVRAARTRLRPILMTSFAFILGVAPLVVATGAGAEMRQSLGTAVFAGMLGVTGFGLLFTPVFYTLVRRIGGKERVATKSKTMSPGVALKG